VKKDSGGADNSQNPLLKKQSVAKKVNEELAPHKGPPLEKKNTALEVLQKKREEIL
jgi:hypothetical protein